MSEDIDSLTPPQISWHTEEVKLSQLFNYSLAEKWIKNTIHKEQKTHTSISIVFCSDDYLLEINREHLDHDYYTDIITFQYEHEPIAGDLFISIDRVRDNAEQLNIPFMDELHRVIIHGILHLIGFKDKTIEDKKEMTAKEDYYLSQLDLL